jgi:hypothetical protein
MGNACAWSAMKPSRAFCVFTLNNRGRRLEWRLKVEQQKWNEKQQHFENRALCCLRKASCGKAGNQKRNLNLINYQFSKARKNPFKVRPVVANLSLSSR